ncbi:MAG: exodeoxyribonuclease V subunit gamma [Clostridia bacterium]|nr:exodeoxyribonuclease V subunit gamma [Clostridia bacterium]
MIRFIYGTYGSGKTTAILRDIARDTAAGIHTFLIVPEQESVQSERATLELLPPSSQLHLEVVNFSRLYNRVCREYGGLSYRYITSPIRHLLMWQNLRELAPLLEEYGNLSMRDTSLCDLMLSARNECKACGISPVQLEEAAKKLSSDAPLAKRLRDLSLIFASFDRLVEENYSDSADDLSRLYDVLKKENFFKGCNVYIDSFTSFTAVEHRIIEKIFAQSENVTVTIPIPYPEYQDISTAGVQESLRHLLASAQQHGGNETVCLRKNRRAASAALAHIAANLWNMELVTEDSRAYTDGSIHMEICNTPYAEAEAVASHVLELLRAGERCRDIVVLTRDPDRYRGIIEPAFEKNEIPYFFSQKTDLSTLPPVKLLLSALRIKEYNWQKNDIISHIKTGMYDFSERSIDLFEEYVNTWNLHGQRFTDRDWTMNPDGFAEEISERGKGILSAANEVRTRLTEILQKFFILLDASETVPDLCRAVYGYFEDLSLDEKLRLLAIAEWEQGNRKEARVIRDLYGILLNALADIATAMPQEPANTEEFALILKTVFGDTDVGSIPTSVDEVVIGSAAMLRPANPKYVFVLGLCEGEFPAAIRDSGVFSSGDRSTLSDLGMELSSDNSIRSSDELMYVHRAFAAPSHGLYLFTTTSELNGKPKTPSLPFNRVIALFSNLTPHRYTGSDLFYLPGAPKSAASHLRELHGTPEGEALRAALTEHLPQIGTLSEESASATECRVSEETARSTTGDSIRFSSSRFEAYVQCPFQYYCTYILGLREKKQASFRASNMGTFIHYILEHLLRLAISESKDGTFPDDETLIQMTEKTVEDYIHRICPEELRTSRRLRHLYTRLKRLSLLMVRNIVEEFSHSQFRPAFFELSTNGREGNPSPMEFVLEDGCRVSFSGIIDRVDLLKKGGEVYVRIVDYKTGTKTFSLDDVAHGINIQMLLYLFTLCRNRDSRFAQQIGLQQDQALTPAGVVYLSANVPIIQAEDYNSEEAVLRQASDSLKRSGLLLNDIEILRAMNDEMSSRFLAGIKQSKKDDSLSGDALCSAESFEQLYTQIKKTVKGITSELRQGKADATPIQYHAKDPCSYCNMKPICRKAD